MAREGSGASFISGGSGGGGAGAGGAGGGGGGGYAGGYPPPGGGGGGLHEDNTPFEPSDVFCALGSLIVEGRLPVRQDEVGGGPLEVVAEAAKRGGRGYTEGPHVEMPGRISKHKCSQDQRLCTKHENFRRHMLLLWQNNVSMCVEVLLCSDCRVGEDKAGSLGVTTVPEPGSILLEQWKVSITGVGAGGGAAGMDYLGLHQAVRSYLHFSQLSAWYNKTGGLSPKNILIRVTIAGEEFSSKFTRTPEEHLFPTAHVGHRSMVSVSVKTLPRTEDIPQVICSHSNNSEKVEKEDTNHMSAIPGALSWRDPTSDLRRSIVFNKAKLGSGDASGAGGHAPGSGGNQQGSGGDSSCPGGRLVKSDSMDSILGDSLLDPPQNINKMTPRRYQSPSRCGSPSLEAPEHLLSGSGTGHHHRRGAAAVDSWLLSSSSTAGGGFVAGSGTGFPQGFVNQQQRGGGGGAQQQPPPSYEQATRMINSVEDPEMFRLNRHDLIRRRDMSLYRGMHPRMIHGAPRLSLPYRAANGQSTSSTLQPVRPVPVLGLPCRAVASMPVPQEDQDQDHQVVVTDQLPNHCTRSGKHICDYEDLDEGNRALHQQQQQQQHIPVQHNYPLPLLVHHSRHNSHSSSSSSGDSSVSGSPTGDNYKQGELGAKAKGWTARSGRSSTPYGRDSSADSDLRGGGKKGGVRGSGFKDQADGYSSRGEGERRRRGDLAEGGELSQAEMGEVLQHLRARMSPVAGKEFRRPSLKDEQLDSFLLHNRLSRRSSIEKILEPQGIKVSPQITQVWRAELGFQSPHLQQQHHSQHVQQPACFQTTASTADNSNNVTTSRRDDKEKEGEEEEEKEMKEEGDQGSILLDAILKHTRFRKPPDLLNSIIHSAKDTITSRFNNQPNASPLEGSQLPTPPAHAANTATDASDTAYTAEEDGGCDWRRPDVCDAVAVEPEDEVQQDQDSLQVKRDIKTDRLYIREEGAHQLYHPSQAGHVHLQDGKSEGYNVYHPATDEVDFVGSNLMTDCNYNWYEAPSATSISPVVSSPDTAAINVVDLCNQMEQKCLISKEEAKDDSSPTADKDEDKSSAGSSPLRTRSYSEASTAAMPHFRFGEPTPVVLEPLDMSFDCYNCYNEDEQLLLLRCGSRSSLDSEGSPPSMLMTDEDSLLRSSGGKSEKRRNSIEEDNIPSANKKAAFRKSFDSATSMVFHSRNGLPLTSSPAPMRRGIKFDFDSGITTPKDIKRALFESQYSESPDPEARCVSSSYANKKKKRDPRRLLSTSAPASVNNNLLGNFEESVLNGRLEPVSTVEGFTAEIGASGSFHPRHLTLPVTVFFYTLCENSNIASPYLGHVNLGKKGYRVPDKGTIQLTLFNPLGTVVKMFVVMYDLTDMPPNSQTFLRQRTLYMPAEASESDHESRKWLRYLIHLRLASSKTGKIYLHTDIRMIIFRKSDLDTASDHAQGKGFELRSFTKGPSNPKFSPRK